MSRFGKAKRQALHMVLLQYTCIEAWGATEWVKMARSGDWHQPVVCTAADIDWAMGHMNQKYWTVME